MCVFASRLGNDVEWRFRLHYIEIQESFWGRNATGIGLIDGTWKVMRILLCFWWYWEDAT